MSRRRPSFAPIESLETRQMLTAAVSGTEVLASFAGKNGLANIAAYLKANPKAVIANYVDLKHSKMLFRDGGKSLVQVRLAKGVTAVSTIKLLKRVAGARFASPNYVYGKQAGEASPNDPKYASQAAALQQIQLEQAWAATTVNPNLVVAVLDDGFDATHPDLQNITWTNAGEIPGNGIDDDGNGYVDDIHGWDFGGNDNNTAPAFDTTYQLTDSHGTQVASVIAANTNNGVGMAGIASGIQLMPVRFRGADVVVTSAGIAQSVAYAVNNGAKIINLSYSFDPYMNDPSFSAAVDLAYSKGALWINSAGNNNVANPPRTTIDKILFVDNVDGNDVKAGDSNYGSGTDVSAPGVGVMAAAPGNQYYAVSGTSFSSAVTTSIAALVWSAHPTWTRDQVAAQILGTADNIDAKNPNYINLLGTGRVNAYQAVAGTLAAPTVRGLSVAGQTLTSSPSTLTLNLKSVLSSTSVAAARWDLRSAGVDGVFDTADDVTYNVKLTPGYAIGTNALTFRPTTALAAGTYRFTAPTTLTDPFGAAMASAYTGTFTVAAAGPAAPSNLAVAVASYSQTASTITWTDNSDNETGFIIERSTKSDFSTIDKTYTASANSTRYDDWGLSQGATYYYRIRATNAQGASVNSNTATLAIPEPPAGVPTAPSSLTGAAYSGSASQVVLGWADNSSNETSFVIQRSSSSTFAAIDKTFSAVANSNTYYDWGLTQGTTYYYRIEAVNGSDASPWSNTLIYKAPTATTAPAAPTGMTASTVSYSDTEAQLNWTVNSNNELNFEIQRSLTSDFASVTTILASAGSGQYNDWGLASGTTYYYRVRAVNTVGNSAWSSTASVKTR